MKRLARCSWAEDVEKAIKDVLPEEQLATLYAHIDECDSCRERLAAQPQETVLEDDLKRADKAWSQLPVDVSTPLQRLNELLSDYEIVREIGRGGMGIVYEARQLKLNRTVALKMLPALLGAVRPTAISRFRREAALAAQLKHNNIIAVYDFGEVDGTLYYAMELIKGRSLRDVLHEIQETGTIDAVIRASSSSKPSAHQNGDAPQTPNPRVNATRIGSSRGTDQIYFQKVARWIVDVAEALNYAHEQGVIHRDVKPSNLLLSHDGRVMISDFGLAQASQFETLTAPRSLIGTARYMSPEQVGESTNPIDRRVDVYALGATLYELLAFRPMFVTANDREVLSQVLNKDPFPPHRFVSQVPSDLETICLKAIEKNREDRYTTAAELADDLQRWLRAYFSDSPGRAETA